MIALGQSEGTLYAVASTAGGEVLLVREGVVVRSTAALAWTRGQPWEQIERRLWFSGYHVRRIAGEGAPAAESVPG